MQILPCTAPTDHLEPAPLTDMSIHMGLDQAALSAFWGGDDAYYVRATGIDGAPDQWFLVAREDEAPNELSTEELIKLGEMMATVLPLSAGRVAFPVGSAGRTVYRIWRSRTTDAQGRTKIRAVRAGRSRRLPA